MSFLKTLGAYQGDYEIDHDDGDCDRAEDVFEYHNSSSQAGAGFEIKRRDGKGSRANRDEDKVESEAKHWRPFLARRRSRTRVLLLTCYQDRGRLLGSVASYRLPFLLETAPGEQCGFAYRILRIKIRACSTAPDIKILYKLQHAAPDAVGAHRTLHPSLYAYFRLIPKLPCLSFMRFLAFFASGRLPLCDKGNRETPMISRALNRPDLIYAGIVDMIICVALIACSIGFLHGEPRAGDGSRVP